jgi:formylglycine-generating enzyme required for sulfatase activity
MFSARVLAALAALAVVAPAARSQEPLAWRLKENDRLYVEYQIKRQDRNQTQARTNTSDEEHTQVYRFTVLSRTPDGGTVLEAALESVRFSDPNSLQVQQTKRLQSERLRATLDAAMNVVRVEGPEAVARANAVVKSPALLALAQRLMDDEVRTMITDAFVALPNRPTRPGDHWQQTTRLAQPCVGLFVLTRTFIDQGDELVEGRTLRKIGVTAALDLRPADWDESELPVKGRRYRLTAQEYAGTLYFDVAAGRLVKLERRHHVALDFTGAAEQGGGSQTTLLTVRVHDHNPLLVKLPKVGPPADPKLPPSGTNSVGMRLVGIPAGKFWMGSPDDEADRFRTEDLREVEITQPFYMGAHEVTVGQFRKFVEETGYQTAAERDGLGAAGWNAQKQEMEVSTRYSWKEPGYPQTDDHPVVLVDWKDAKAFCEWLSKKEKRVYRLPTEAEWEYCCRAGTTTRYYSGDDADGVAAYGNVSDQSAKKLFPTWQALGVSDGHVFPAPVGSYKPNAWGLYDMHGNANEWCEDWYWDYDKREVRDPKGPPISDRKVARGGSWVDFPQHCRSAYRNAFEQSSRSLTVGFRVVLENLNK